MSVWQEFLIGLAHVYPNDQDEIEITDLVFKLFKILLHHAIKYEYGGWRVWIDTLSILHSRVSKEDYQLKMNKLYEDYERSRDSLNTSNTNNNSLTRSTIENDQSNNASQNNPDTSATSANNTLDESGTSSQNTKNDSISRIFCFFIIISYLICFTWNLSIKIFKYLKCTVIRVL
jgi:hypothetical protein